MEDGDKAHKSPGSSTVGLPGPSMVKPSVPPSKAKLDMAQGYDNFFNEEEDESDDDLEIEDGFNQRERLRMT